MNVLDVGTGTGVLAIASIKLGAASVIATDIDDWAIDNATENVIANNCEKQIIVSRDAVESFKESSFNLVAANLTLNTNLEFLDDFHRVLVSDGLLLLSGLLTTDSDAIAEGLKRGGFHILEKRSEGEWIALAATPSS